MGFNFFMKHIEAIIKEVLVRMNIDSTQFQLEHTDFSFGDYTTNIALIASKVVGENPKTLADTIAKEIEQVQSPLIQSVSVAGPGFINITLSNKAYSDVLSDCISREQLFGTNNFLEGAKTIVEYTDPNPFKEFHLGHLMSNTIGESIARIVEANGAEVKRACYSGDKGMHVARAVAHALKEGIVWESVKDVARSYAEGSKKVKDDPDFLAYVTEINKKIYDESDEEINALYQKGRTMTLEYFETIYQTLGTAFDYYFFESVTGNFGKEVVLSHTPSIFEKSEEAIVYRGEARDPSLHTRVFINKEGLPTYEAKELGLAKVKYETYPYDASIVITGNEVDDYFRVLLRAMKEVFPDLEKKTKHLSHGMLRLPTGKMSSRTGDVITAESVISDAEEKAKEVAKDKKSDDEKLPLQIAVGAIKFSILKQAPGRDIIFDMNTSISFEGDSGPYLQYTRARILSIEEKAREQGIQKEIALDWQYDTLPRMILRFPDIVKRAGEEYAPHYIVTYLLQLASSFNAFYASSHILEGDTEVSRMRLLIASATGQVIENGLTLLGIPVPKKM